MQAMLRIAFRLGADLESAFMHVNNCLAETLPADRFITAFIGLLDPSTHRMRFHSGGQGPILHYQAGAGTCVRYKPTSFPLGAMPLTRLKPALTLEMLPGDILALLSDGFYEYRNLAGEQSARPGFRNSLARIATSRWPTSSASCRRRSTHSQGARRRRTT